MKNVISPIQSSMPSPTFLWRFKVALFLIWGLICCKVSWDSVMRMDANLRDLFLYEAFLYYNPLLLVTMMVWLWGVNLWVFLQSSISYPKIFDLDQNHLTHREIWKCSTWMTIVVPTSMTAYLYLYSHGEVSLAASQPVLLYIFVAVILIFPFDIFYLSSRYFFLRTLLRIAFPLQPISFPDFFLADILTSMAKVFSDLERSVCRMVNRQVATIAWLEADSVCGSHSIAIPIVLVLPYLWRLLQCLRQYKDTKEKNCLFNGSVLSGGGSEPLPKATAEDWVNMINEFQKGALASRLGIPMIYGIDAVHGHNNVYNATIFPHNVGLGCTRDPDLAKRIGAATALEVRATGIPYVFAPCIAVCRDPRWGRCYESYSEDPKIVQEMTEIIPGLQGDIPSPSKKGFPYVGGKTKVAACAKHFVGDGGTTKGKNEDNTVIDWHGLLSIHMPAYSDAILKGVSTVMVSYSSWNGVKMHADRDLITGFLKNTLKFKGFVISDWQGIDKITTPIDSNYTYSVQASIQAGVDMVMVPYKFDDFIQDLNLLVKSNIIPMDRIDDAVERILLVKFTMGLFENPLADFSLVNELGSQEHRDLAREAVRKSLVLLKNGKNGSAPLLPLPKAVPKLLVAGTHANNLGYQCGGWTIKWQGFTGNSDTSGTTILSAINSTVDPSTEVIFRENPNNEFVKSNNFAYAIIVVGELPYAETAGDSTALTLADPGPNIINNVCGTIKCVVVVVSGRPLAIEPYVSNIDALVAAWLPGSEGQGVTDVLFGDYGFSGKLARTWFKSVDQLPMNVGDQHYDPLYPFGFGLTTESVRDLVERSTSSALSVRVCIFTVMVTLLINLYLTG